MDTTNEQQLVRQRVTRCQREGCFCDLTKLQIKHRNRYCGRSCAALAQEGRNLQNIERMNKSRAAAHLRGVKMRLWDQALILKQPETTVETIVQALYRAEKRGYYRGYNTANEKYLRTRRTGATKLRDTDTWAQPA